MYGMYFCLARPRLRRHSENHLTKNVSVVTNSFRSDNRYKQLSTPGNINQLEMNDCIQYILGIYCTYIYIYIYTFRYGTVYD